MIGKKKSLVGMVGVPDGYDYARWGYFYHGSSSSSSHCRFSSISDYDDFDMS